MIDFELEHGNRLFLNQAECSRIIKACLALYKTYEKISQAPICLVNTGITEEDALANSAAFIEWEESLAAVGLIDWPEYKPIEEVLG